MKGLTYSLLERKRGPMSDVGRRICQMSGNRCWESDVKKKRYPMSSVRCWKENMSNIMCKMFEG